MEASGEGVQLDLEVGAELAVHVAFDDSVAEAIREEVDLTRGRERILSDERERLISRGTKVGIDLPQVDDVSAKILDHVAAVDGVAGIEGRKARTGKHERVLTV